MAMEETSIKDIDIGERRRSFLQLLWNRECSQVEVALLVAFVSKNQQDLAVINVNYVAGKATIKNASEE